MSNFVAKILLFHGRGLIGHAIRWQTDSKYSHAAIQMGYNGPIIEAWQGYKAGVRRKMLTDWSGIDTFDVVQTPEQTDRIGMFLSEQIGKQYNYWGVFRFLVRTGIKINDKWFCSELVYAAFQAAGINLLHRTQPAEVSPGLLSRSPLLIAGKVELK